MTRVRVCTLPPDRIQPLNHQAYGAGPAAAGVSLARAAHPRHALTFCQLRAP